MRREIGYLFGAAALGSTLALAVAQPRAARAAAPVTIEKGLLGIRILQSYRDVFRKFGPPTRVYRSGETIDMVEALDAQGMPTGGIIGLGGTGQANRGVARGGPGMPGMGYPGMAPGMPGAGFRPPGAGMGGRGIGAPSGPPPGMMGGYPGMMGRGPGMSGPPPGVFQGYGYPGMAGRPGGMSGGPPAGMMGGYPGMAGRPGMSATTGARNNTENEDTFRSAGGYMWTYLNPRTEHLYVFLFNNDGRVTAIQEFGRNGGTRTQRGIGLGSPVSAVYQAYGWPDDTDQEGNYLQLFYGPKAHVQFTTLNNKVVAITVVLSENMRYRHTGATGQGAGLGMGRGPSGAPGFGGRGPAMGSPGGFGGGRGKRGDIE